jgi:hypothetical protein
MPAIASGRWFVLNFACLASLVACAMTPRTALDVPAVEGLAQVRSRHYDVALVRPGTEFSSYRRLIVQEPEVAYRTPDRDRREFALSDEQKSQFHALLKREFELALTGLETLDLVTEAGPDVLDLQVRVQDVVVAVPGPVRAIGATIGLEAAGEATLVMELRDSESEEVLARVYDQRALRGAAILQDGQPVTGWKDIQKLCAAWAGTARLRLDGLVREN